MPKLNPELSASANEIEQKIIQCYKGDKVLDCHAIVAEYRNLRDLSLKNFATSA